MRKIREVPRLTAAGLSARQMAASVKLVHSTVADYLHRAEAAQVHWPLPDEVDEDTLMTQLYPAAASCEPNHPPLPDWSRIHQELTRKGVTLMLLWQEYKVRHPDGYQYSRFADSQPKPMTPPVAY